MPVLRLVAEHIGPFEKLDLDFSDDKGNPHPGPHILAGVNGSGKSTALRALAWVLDGGTHGFPYESWEHFLCGKESRALVHLKPPLARWSAPVRSKRESRSDVVKSSICCTTRFE